MTGSSSGASGGMEFMEADRDSDLREASFFSLLEEIVELSDDAILTCDKTSRIASWGAPATRLFGQEGHDVIGRQLETLVAEQFRQAIIDLMEFVTAGARIRHFETEIMRPDGMSTPMALSVSRIVDADDAFVGFVVIARDMTEQYVAQAALAEVEARVEDDEALAHVGSWMWDVRTGAVQWSAEFYRIHGIDPLEFDGTLDAFLTLVDPADRAALHATMLAATDAGSRFEFRFRLAQQASAGPIEIRARPMSDSRGATIGFRGIGQRAPEE
jgi:PAS domain S-box-containing protein